MIGYNFKLIYGGFPFFFHFVEEKYSQLFSQLIEEFSLPLSEQNSVKEEEEEETMTVIKTLDKLIVLQFIIQYNNNKKENFKQKITKTTFKFLLEI
ncbi:hypothetical protein Mgra_00007848 [Meloidogyne graminicola]|uniref:Uncharacterized protein n=1 Tax=Meloidogyne graminicola TaxID=189291 RepID=A0A8S9ZHI8_9BILA|nr:hypothetical protein Mgra_00007848 [Meloidogyne graminicola]